jgi:hypothetical protein
VGVVDLDMVKRKAAGRDVSGRDENKFRKS